MLPNNSLLFSKLFYLVVTLFLIAPPTTGMQEEKDLFNVLFKDYNKQVRPIMKVKVWK